MHGMHMMLAAVHMLRKLRGGFRLALYSTRAALVLVWSPQASGPVAAQQGFVYDSQHLAPVLVPPEAGDSLCCPLPASWMVGRHMHAKVALLWFIVTPGGYTERS